MCDVSGSWDLPRSSKLKIIKIKNPTHTHTPLTHVLRHVHLHVLFLEVLHGLQGLLRVHLLIDRLHGLESRQRRVVLHYDTESFHPISFCVGFHAAVSFTMFFF